MHELRDEAEPTLRELVPHLSPVDLVIVEGFKAESHREARSASQRRRASRCCYPNDPNIVAIASDSRPTNAPLPLADLNDIEAIADLVDELARPYPP